MYAKSVTEVLRGIIITHSVYTQPKQVKDHCYDLFPGQYTELTR